MKLFFNAWMIFLALLVVTIISVSHGGTANALQSNWQKNYLSLQIDCINSVTKHQSENAKEVCE